MARPAGTSWKQFSAWIVQVNAMQKVLEMARNPPVAFGYLHRVPVLFPPARPCTHPFSGALRHYR
jgi:hypothetical protein